ncbi:hypothetical protein LINGRAHAP2_LOCUS29173 [Linum grandiflorum]
MYLLLLFCNYFISFVFHRTDDINPSNEDTWKDLRFPTTAEALTFYVQYGQYKGFDVKNQLAQRNVVPGKFYYLKYTCNRALYRENSEHDPKNAGKMDPKPRVNIVGELKIGCEAFITMRTDKINNLYSITKFQDKHNHLLQGDEGTIPEGKQKHSYHIQGI